MPRVANPKGLLARFRNRGKATGEEEYLCEKCGTVMPMAAGILKLMIGTKGVLAEDQIAVCEKCDEAYRVNVVKGRAMVERITPEWLFSLEEGDRKGFVSGMAFVRQSVKQQKLLQKWMEL